ncbi:cellulase family glycosylhydrolase [Ruminococcus sp.]|uniref:cellulase family glycosylhydrolase n=1 Tax=Ruminococcus sp. TaxID=41978 RepID=UPI0025E205C8|nr:cellulase family glycosylhydrolase [Ruminococcus sp.]
MKHWKKLAALLLAGVMSASVFTGCGSQNGGSGSAQKEESSAAETSAEDSQETEAPETTVETTTVHVSPVETVSSTLGTEITDINAILDRSNEDANNYKAKLSNFIEEGDVVQSFTFIVYAADGSSNLGDYKGGYGVSVTSDCASATDEGWYQAADFEQSLNSSYAEFTWNVPTEIQSYIDPNGEVLFGHWWSNVQQVKLSSIVCTYTRTKEVPVDGTNSVSPAATLNYNDEATKTAKVSLSDLIGEEDTLQTVTFDISSSGSLGKFTGAFGVSVDENADCATDKGWYQSQNVCVFTDASSLSLTWIVPDDVKESIDNGGDIMLGFWWSDQASITLNNVSVRYSNSTGTTTQTKPKTDAIEASGNAVPSVSGEVPTSEEVNAMTSAQIVENIKVGWNLGNTLDSYNTNSSDTETGWGNPKTTKAMFEAVQDAGFNAVRIPVTWGEHMSADGTIEADWMARVKEVVDYAYDCGLYVILNVHHDDSLWLTPTNDKLESDKVVLTNIWKQICAEFQDYDHRLIFEGMNEPRVVGSAEEWTGGTQESYNVINQLFQAFVDTVRASGGANTDRTVIVTTYAQSVEKNAVSGLKVPDDDHIIVSLHIYAPWKFCGPEDARADWGSDADKSELDTTFQYLNDTFVSKGIPVIIDECGAVNKNENTSARAAWYGYYISAAKKHGIKCFLWDNGEKADGFALLDRKNCTWYYPEIIQAIMNAAS